MIHKRTVMSCVCLVLVLMRELSGQAYTGFSLYSLILV